MAGLHKFSLDEFQGLLLLFRPLLIYVLVMLSIERIDGSEKQKTENGANLSSHSLWEPQSHQSIAKRMHTLYILISEHSSSKI